MQTLKHDEQNYLEYRDTPWDQRTFGFRCNEILSTHASGEVEARLLLADFERSCEGERVQFSYTRIPAGNRILKAAFYGAGYYITECSLDVMVSVKDFRCPVAYGSVPMHIEEATEDDLPALRQIAADSFDYSRMHEDFNIPPPLARLRYSRWIDDLWAQKKIFHVHREEGKPIWFNVFEITPDHSIHSIVGGSARGMGLFSYAACAFSLDYCRKQGIKRMFTTISAANLGVMNMHFSLNYKVVASYYGFHRHRVMQTGEVSTVAKK